MSGTRLLAIGLLVLLVAAASSAGAGVRMYKGEWIADSFGNDRVQAVTMPTPTGAEESLFWSALGNPIGVFCNEGIPRCKLSESPTTTNQQGMKVFAVLGQNCAPYTVFGPTRPTAAGRTLTTGGGYVSTMTMGINNRVPPLYRNPAFFTPGKITPNSAFAQYPDVNKCGGDTTAGGRKATAYLPPFHYRRGVIQQGAPISGSGSATTTTPNKGFTIPKAPEIGPGGMRRTTLGSFSDVFPYLYSYTYNTLRNATGVFQAGGGFFTTAGVGSFSFPYRIGANTVAKAVVKAGANKFGGTMKLLGRSTGKVCYFLQGGCSLGGWRDNATAYGAPGTDGVADGWRYQSIGGYTTTARFITPVAGGWTKAAKYQYIIATEKYYNTNGMGTSLIYMKAWRFPWTTGTVTVTATGRGPNNTIEQRKGYDRRMKHQTVGKGGKIDYAHYGPIQLVSPLLTRWLQPATNFETGGIGVVRFRFMPEPHKWMLLVAGLSLLGVLYRVRGR